MVYVWIAFAQAGDDPKNPTSEILGVFTSKRLAQDVITTEKPKTGESQRYKLDEYDSAGDP